MKKILTILMASIVIASCGENKGSEKQEAIGNTAFDTYKTEFIDALWQTYPVWASGQGYHKYDSVLVVPNAQARDNEMKFITTWLEKLAEFDTTSFSPENLTDFHIISNQLHSLQWGIQAFKSYEWNPADYNVSDAFAVMLANDYDQLDTRLLNFYQRAAAIPAFYEAAKANIKNPTKEHLALAIEQNEGGVSVFTTELDNALAKCSLPESKKTAIKDRANAAVAAINGYVTWLKAFQNNTPRSFRLGKELYSQKFVYDIQSEYSAEEVYEKAIAQKKELHQKMAALASSLWSKYMEGAPQPTDTLQLIRAVIDKISLQHTTPDSFQASIEKQLPVLVQFIKDKNLIYIDSTKPLVVRKEPAYMAGVAGASISAPGPYDKGGNTYYNVGSLSGWDKQRAESYLREYNNYILQILNIHEAIPGHYTQLVYSNQSPSLVKSLFGSSSMIEGWAVYTERMMLEAGYDNNAPEMWLMYYKWHLRSICNTILDYSVHTLEMSKEQALDLLVNQAFQQQAEAEGKWKRVSVTQVQLCCYYTGYREIYDLREQLKQKEGKDFELKKFHERFLSYGSAPVKFIKQLMLAGK